MKSLYGIVIGIVSLVVTISIIVLHIAQIKEKIAELYRRQQRKAPSKTRYITVNLKEYEERLRQADLEHNKAVNEVGDDSDGNRE